MRQLLNPPFSRTFAELAGLSDDQLIFLYDVERGPDGRMVTKPPPAEWPDPRALHARRCFLLGITEAWKVEKLWSSK